MADYEYSPLSNGQIRLLSIDPALDPPDHPISCRLVTTELRTGLSYRALSYVWGPPHPEAEIRLDGHPVTVRANLAAILQAIRSTCRATYLWIDAICVNQKHNEEKAEQVAVMADIYYQAEEVLMWLGPSNETTKADMAMFRSVEDCLKRHGINDMEGFVRSTSEISREAEAMMKDLFAPLAGYTFTSSVSKSGGCLTHPWWTRTWTIQECLLARKLTFTTGDDEASFLPLLALAYLLGQYGNGTYAGLRTGGEPPPSDFSLVVEFRLVAEAALRRGERPTFDNILLAMSQFRSRDASDPRDKIFGLLGLVSDAKVLWDLTPCYDTSIESVYQDFSRKLALQRHLPPLRLLSLSGIGYHSSGRRLRIPTWMPDWRREIIGGFPTPFGAGSASYYAAQTSGNPFWRNDACPPEVPPGDCSDGPKVCTTAIDCLRAAITITAQHIDPTGNTPTVRFPGNYDRPLDVLRPLRGRVGISKAFMVCESGELVVFGRFVGRILSCLPPPRESSFFATTPLWEGWQAFLFRNPKFSYQDLEYSPGIPLLQAFWRTVCGQMDPNTRGLLIRPLPSEGWRRYPEIASFLLHVEPLAPPHPTHDVGGRLEYLLSHQDIPEELGLGTFFDKKRSERSWQWPEYVDIGEALDTGLTGLEFPFVAGRSLFVTEHNIPFIGLGPPLVEGGDTIMIPFDSEVPVILREQANGKFKLVGECFVLGCMFGEFVDKPCGFAGADQPLFDIVVIE